MQQTKQYALNLIETSDAFSPEPLNENAETVEKELARLDGANAAESAARDVAVAALADRVVALEAKKIVVGTYSGNRSSTGSDATDWHFIRLGFTPVAVFVAGGNANDAFFTTGDKSATDFRIAEKGFEVRNSGNTPHNSSNNTYCYIAFT